MTVTRRHLILGTSVLAIAATFAVLYLRPDAPRTVRAETGPILDLIEQEFGPQVALTEAAQDFATDLRERSSAPLPEGSVVFAFIRATNVLRAAETGEALVYVGLEDLQTFPCRNTLSSHWL